MPALRHECVIGVTTVHRMGVCCGHMQRVNTIQPANSAGSGQGQPQGDTGSKKGAYVKFQPHEQFSETELLSLSETHLKGSDEGQT